MSGLCPVYHRDENCSLFLAADQSTGAFFVSVNPFHARHVRETKSRRPTGEQQGHKAGLRSSWYSAYQMVVQHSSTFRCVPSFHLHRVSFARASEDMSRMVVFIALDGNMGSYLLGTRLAADPLFAARPAPLRPAAFRRPATPQWYVHFLESTGSFGNS